MKRIAVDAYLNSNLGDDLFLTILCRRYPRLHFFVRSGAAALPIVQSLDNLHLLRNDGFTLSGLLYRGVNFLRKRLRGTRSDWYVERCDARLLISGSCFMEQAGPEMIAWHDFFLREHSYVMGCNFGPYHSDEYLETYRRILARPRAVCFRDRFSYALFRQLPNAACAPDIVFAYPRQERTDPPEKDYLLLCPAPLSKDGRSDLAPWEERYLALHREVVRQTLAGGRSVVILSFCEEQDRPVAEAICAGLEDSSRVRLVDYPRLSVREAAGYLAGADAVLATRYHAMILALLYERPVFALCYSDKLTHVIEDLDCGIPHCTPQQLDHLTARQVLDALSHPLPAAALETIRRAAADAEQHFAAFDRDFGPPAPGQDTPHN